MVVMECAGSLMRRWFVRLTLKVAAIGLAAIVAWEMTIRLLPPPSLDRYNNVSQRVDAANGSLLRAFLTVDQKWRFKTVPADLPAGFVEMLTVYEDKRFWSHNGIDMAALARAGWQFLSNARVISGGSTLTMQVARLLHPRARGLWAKVRQLVAARQLEQNYSKKQLLSMYLTLAPFGGNVEGVRAAALIYYGKEPAKLSLAEAALLIALPQSPEARRPDLHPEEALTARNHVLWRAAAAGVVPMDTVLRLEDAPVRVKRHRLLLFAPHAAELARRRVPNKPFVATWIDSELQGSIERLVQRSTQIRLARISAAAIVIRNQDMAVRAYLSGPDYFSDVKSGQYDLVAGIRSPGSALKPFIYGLAFEKLIAHPLTIVVDQPRHYGAFAPRNFLDDYHGEVTIRDALIRSLNTAAVAVLAKVGPDRFMARLRQAGVVLRIGETDTEAGLAVALGGCGISVADLAKLYAALANGGRVRKLRLLKADAPREDGRLLSEEATWAVSDILADAVPPDGYTHKRTADGGRRLAYKTGTSYGFRDAWAAGYDRLHTVVVWIGRPDGAPTRGATGRDAAAPVLFQIFDLLPVPEEDVAGAGPRDTVLSKRKDLPSRLERLSMKPVHALSQPLKITFPPDGARIRLQPQKDRNEVNIPMQASGGQPPYLWYLNDEYLSSAAGRAALKWPCAERGRLKVQVIDATGASASIEIWIE